MYVCAHLEILALGGCGPVAVTPAGSITLPPLYVAQDRRAVLAANGAGWNVGAAELSERAEPSVRASLSRLTGRPARRRVVERPARRQVDVHLLALRRHAAG